jgi:hypothetical protein
MEKLISLSKQIKTVKTYKESLQSGLRYTDMLYADAKYSNLEKYGNFYSTRYVDLWRRLCRKNSILANQLHDLQQQFEIALDDYIQSEV